MDDLGHPECSHPREKVLPWLGSVEEGTEREGSVREEEEGQDGELELPSISFSLSRLNTLSGLGLIKILHVTPVV